MIIQPGVPWVSLAQFRDVLDRAGDTVVRVAQNAGTSATGWRIAPDLVVAPGYALDDASTAADVFCRDSIAPQRGVVVARAGLEHPLGGALALRLERAEVNISLCKLPEHPTAVLSFETLVIGAPLWIVHHADGADLPGLSTQGLSAPWLSLGKILEVAPDRIVHDGNTEAGSAGAPLFDLRGRVIGMHSLGTAERQINEAAPIHIVLEWLRGTAVWPEIAAYHRIATSPTATPVEHPPREQSPPWLRRLAVRWHIDPSAVDDSARKTLTPLVIDPQARRWALQPAHRQRLLAELGSRVAMVAARGSETVDEPGQRAIDRILEGPPFDLDAVDFSLLPHLLQAVRWFQGLVPEVPTPGQVQRALERRRVRERLRAIVGDDFLGRKTELDTIEAWFADLAEGPLVISGIGGIGKSSVVARFAETRPRDTLLLWLDFDRPDIAPDAAESIVGAIAEQCAAQLDDFTHSDPADESWQATAERLGVDLARALRDQQPPLLVLDSFEIAQHVTRYQELWPVLERLVAAVPHLRIIVTGRAPVPGLTLAGRPAEPLPLKGLTDADADLFLVQHGITDAVIRAQTVRLAQGIPLVLVLAVHLVRAGGDITNSDDYPRQLIEGFLYDRILNRVVDPELIPLARSALVLRKITAEALAAVLADRLPEATNAEQAFIRLRQELALVDGDRELRVRPEVRAATLRMLEQEDPEAVRRIDAAAVRWYSKQPLDDAGAAELTYHHLRLGDLAGAARAFRADSLQHLRDGLDTLRGESLAWLSARLGAPSLDVIDLDGWEADALRRIRDALARGHTRPVSEILNERAERSPASPLVFYDAWSRATQSDDAAGALELLSRASSDFDREPRERAVLRAWLLARTDPIAADAVLAPWIASQKDAGGPDPLVSIAIEAARLWLTLDLTRERHLLGELRARPEAELGILVRSVMSSSDVADPQLGELLSGRSRESLADSIDFDRATARGRAHEARLQAVEDPHLRAVLHRKAAAIFPARLPTSGLANDLTPAIRALLAAIPEPVLELTLAAEHRWIQLIDTSIAARIDRFVSQRRRWTALHAASAYTLIFLYPRAGWSFNPALGNHSISGVFMSRYVRRLAEVPGVLNLAALKDRLDNLRSRRGAVRKYVPNINVETNNDVSRILASSLYSLSARDQYAIHFEIALALPDLLTLLVRHFAGLPDNSE